MQYDWEVFENLMKEYISNVVSDIKESEDLDEEDIDASNIESFFCAISQVAAIFNLGRSVK